MPKAITKKAAIEKLHLAPDIKIKAIEWIKLPENGRLLVYEIRRQDYILPGRERVEVRYHVYPTSGGGSGGVLGQRNEKKRKR